MKVKDTEESSHRRSKLQEANGFGVSCGWQGMLGVLEKNSQYETIPYAISSSSVLCRRMLTHGNRVIPRQDNYIK